MHLQKYIGRIHHLDALIRTKATGNPKQLAKKMSLSERAVLQYIRMLKEMGCPVKFCRKRNSYYYEKEGKVIISFFDEQTIKAVSGVKNRHDDFKTKFSYTAIIMRWVFITFHYVLNILPF